ncbi:citrate:H+ symporter [Candidatus Epulonipiscium fishelsonii]|uniref:Citrate:H+ symporter n=1 Tax=Candidatus Epulonipiscium fishelsonii TaxID=77094 RepID=A0ACC8XAX5_9FIRM|nr:citrate:H+ symporter [Epulopiscium sp. SCG-B11WGA-EpuloA1]
MVFSIIYLLLKNKATPLTLFILFPPLFALPLGFSIKEISEFATIGIHTTMSNALLFMFCIPYFSIMSDAGMFDKIIAKLLSKANDNVILIAVITIIMTLICQLGGASTTALVAIPALLPIYKKLHMRVEVLALIIASGMGITNLVPWGAPTARVAIVLGVKATDIWQRVFPVQIAGVIIVICSAMLLGLREKHLIKNSEFLESEDIQVYKNEILRQPKNVGINLALTITLIGTLVVDIIPSYIVFMIGFAIAMLINFPNITSQDAQLRKHAPTALLLPATMITSGIFVGIISETGMLHAMANSLLYFIPDFLGQHLHIIMGILSTPIGIALGADAFYYGLLPLIIEVGKTYGVDPMNIAITMLVGKNVSVLISPLVPSLFLVLSLTGLELNAHIKFCFKWLFGISILLLLCAITMGVVVL